MMKTDKAHYDDAATEKEIYLSNRDEIIERFNEVVKTIDKVSDKDIWQNFALVSMFNLLRDQERFIEHIVKNGHKFADIKKERYMMTVFIKKAEEVCGKEYKAIKTVLDKGE
jgi:hypothetical protein